jgi:hypothetical protein
MRQAEFFTRRVYNRQAYQWKLTLGLWTLIVVGVAFLFDKSVSIPYYVGALIVLSFAAFWLSPVAISNNNDHKLTFHYRGQAALILADESHVIEPEPPRTFHWYEFLRSWAHVFELVTTILLVLFAMLLLHRGPLHAVVYYPAPDF